MEEEVLEVGLGGKIGKLMRVKKKQDHEQDLTGRSRNSTGFKVSHLRTVSFHSEPHSG